MLSVVDRSFDDRTKEADCSGGTAVSDAGLAGLRLEAAWPRPLRQQIIAPFFLLLVFVALLGVAALSYQGTGAGLSGLDQALVRESVQANDALATVEAGRLNDLRTV